MFSRNKDITLLGMTVQDDAIRRSNTPETATQDSAFCLVRKPSSSTTAVPVVSCIYIPWRLDRHWLWPWHPPLPYLPLCQLVNRRTTRELSFTISFVRGDVVIDDEPKFFFVRSSNSVYPHNSISSVQMCPLGCNGTVKTPLIGYYRQLLS